MWYGGIIHMNNQTQKLAKNIYIQLAQVGWSQKHLGFQEGGI
jgi:hypothetical protein